MRFQTLICLVYTSTYTEGDQAFDLGQFKSQSPFVRNLELIMSIIITRFCMTLPSSKFHIFQKLFVLTYETFRNP